MGEGELAVMHQSCYFRCLMLEWLIVSYDSVPQDENGVFQTSTVLISPFT